MPRDAGPSTYIYICMYVRGTRHHLTDMENSLVVGNDRQFLRISESEIEKERHLIRRVAS